MCWGLLCCSAYFFAAFSENVVEIVCIGTPAYCDMNKYSVGGSSPLVDVLRALSAAAVVSYLHDPCRAAGCAMRLVSLVANILASSRGVCTTSDVRTSPICELTPRGPVCLQTPWGLDCIAGTFLVTLLLNPLSTRVKLLQPVYRIVSRT